MRETDQEGRGGRKEKKRERGRGREKRAEEEKGKGHALWSKIEKNTDKKAI